MAIGPGLIVAVERNIVRRLAQAAEASDVEDWESALPDIRTVSAGNSELQSDVLTKEIICTVLTHTRESENLVEEQVRRDNPAMAERRQLRQRGSSRRAVSVA